MRRSITAFALAAVAALLPSSALAQEQVEQGAAGEYRDEDSFEMFHGLLLREDGTFLYALSVGALDQQSAGTWTQQGGTVTLTTAPTPVPPEFREVAPDEGEDAPLVQVSWPHGGGVALVDVTLGCADGSVVAGYTQLDGWSPPDDEPCADPQWLELTVPMHDIRSPRYDLAGRVQGLRFVLEPNDFGIVDLTGTTGTVKGDRLVLTLRGVQRVFVRTPPQ